MELMVTKGMKECLNFPALLSFILTFLAFAGPKNVYTEQDGHWKSNNLKALNTFVEGLIVQF
jgi:hypothetical protein